MSEATKVIRVIPTTQVTGYWHHDYSDYPDEIKVKMADGKSVTYVREIVQPHPKCQRAIDLIRTMNTGYQAKHEKKAGAAATATDQ